MIGPAVAVPVVTRVTESAVLIPDAPEVLSVNPAAALGLVPVLLTLLRVLELRVSGAVGESSYTFN